MKKENPQKSLFEIADSQMGYFTAAQAIAAGITNNNHLYHIKQGNWIRERRGIYRLTKYPNQNYDQYALWAVWSMNRKGEMLGVYSHETALSLYDFTDINPVKIHLTIPRGFRRHSEIPSELKLHYSIIEPIEVEEREGFKITKLFRTIADLVRAQSISDDIIVQAVNQGLSTGKLTQTEYTSLKKMPRVGGLLSRIMGEVK